MQNERRIPAEQAGGVRAQLKLIGAGAGFLLVPAVFQLGSTIEMSPIPACRAASMINTSVETSEVELG